MKEYFKAQLKENKPITKETLSKLKGKGIFSDYEIGDTILWFLECKEFKTDDPIPTPLGNSNIRAEMTLNSVTERELDLFENNYEYIEQKGMFPVFKKKEE